MNAVQEKDIEEPEEAGRLQIRFRNGKVHNLKLVEIEDAKGRFEILAGFRFNQEESKYSQTITALKSWLGQNGLHHEQSQDVILFSHRLIADEFAEKKNGFVAYNEDRVEPLVVYRDNQQEYACLISPMVYSEMAGKSTNREKHFVKAQLQGWGLQESTIEGLTGELNMAIENKQTNMVPFLSYLIERMKDKLP